MKICTTSILDPNILYIYLNLWSGFDLFRITTNIVTYQFIFRVPNNTCVRKFTSHEVLSHGKPAQTITCMVVIPWSIKKQGLATITEDGRHRTWLPTSRLDAIVIIINLCCRLEISHFSELPQVLSEEENTL